MTPPSELAELAARLRALRTEFERRSSDDPDWREKDNACYHLLGAAHSLDKIGELYR